MAESPDAGRFVCECGNIMLVGLDKRSLLRFHNKWFPVIRITKATTQEFGVVQWGLAIGEPRVGADAGVFGLSEERGEMRMHAAWALILVIGWLLMGPMEMAAMAAEGHSVGLSRSGGSLGHEGIEVGVEPTPPSIKLIVHKDPMAGWNLQRQVDNFRFAPEHASTAHVPGEGHVHLYIDGKKITRLYGEWYRIPSLSPGAHKIRVTLNANSHEDLMLKGKVVSDKQEVRVSAK